MSNLAPNQTKAKSWFIVTNSFETQIESKQCIAFRREVAVKPYFAKYERTYQILRTMCRSVRD